MSATVDQKRRKYRNKTAIVDGVRRAWTDQDDEMLINLRRQGRSFSKIAEVMGRSKNSVELRGARLAGKGLAPAGVRGRVLDDPASNFWDGVDRSGGPSACWPWTRARYGIGRYGAASFNLGDGKRVHGTHRLAFLLSGGLLTSERPHVIHSCDNKICCNPAHLSAGSHSENIQQAYDRGLIEFSTKRGRESHFSRVTEEDVLAIRKRAKNGESIAALADAFGLSKSGTHHIITGRTWSHIDGQ